MKYVYFEFRMLRLEVSLILASVLQGGAVGVILSLWPHRSRSIGNAIDRVGIDKVMYFLMYFIFVFAAQDIQSCTFVHTTSVSRTSHINCLVYKASSNPLGSCPMDWLLREHDI
jgi:hypothetical protein